MNVSKTYGENVKVTLGIKPLISNSAKVVSMPVRDFKVGRDHGHLELLPPKNFGEYLTQWSFLMLFSSNFHFYYSLE